MRYITLLFYTVFKIWCAFYCILLVQLISIRTSHISGAHLPHRANAHIHFYCKSRNVISNSFHILSMFLAARKSRLNIPGLPKVRFDSCSKYVKVEEKRRGSSKVACDHVSFRKGKIFVGYHRHGRL